MFKNIYTKILLIILGIGLIFGVAYFATQPKAAKYDGSVTVELIDEGGFFVESRLINFKTGDVFINLLGENFDIVTEEHAVFGAMLHKINTLDDRVGATLFIPIEINGESATTGISGIILVDKDTISFILTDWSK